ncbi:MAG: SusE domain-containing protein [Ginsengibacter sp.]
MNKQFKILALLAICFIALFTSCKKDEVKVVATEGTKPVLTASAVKMNFVEADSASKAVDLTWQKSDYGYDAAVSYFLQFSYKDSAFKKVAEQAMGSSLTKSFTVADFNKLLLSLKFPSGVTDTVFVRVRSQITPNVFQLSDPVAIVARPYVSERVITYDALYVPGAYQGWSPDAAVIAKLYSVNSDKAYEGYVNFTDAEFKITPAPKWDNSYGMVTNTGNAGTMAYNGGNNFSVTPGGYYLMKANTATNMWSATLNNWGIIGAAAVGWGDNDDVMFEFNSAKQTLTKTLTLQQGEMKFRSNHNWDVNIGKDGKYGGDNIKIDVAGTYKVTLDLRVPSEPVYSIDLQ